MADWLSLPRLTVVREPRPDQKRACVVRYGAFGDMLQTSNILPGLRRAGFHVTVMTTPQGRLILEHDPHVDAWLEQDNEEVPNHELCDYWEAWEPQFDRWVNLSESVEGTLLAFPGRTNFLWPDWLRHKEMNRNYLEWTSELAGIPYRSEAQFYPTQAEIDEVNRFRSRHPGFLIVYALSGSSIHKFYPWVDQLVARVMLELPAARIVTVGDMACQLLEQGWENEARVIRTSGKLHIRQVLSLAKYADVVMGPETGVLNAVAFERYVRKVVLLSHSSRENLTKHWLSTDTIEPVNTPCYPCHRLHYNRKHCPEHQGTGAAVCQASIPVPTVFRPIARCYAAWEKKAA